MVFKGLDVILGQIRAVLGQVTSEIRNQGVEATRFIYDQLKKLAESLGLPIPPSILDVSFPQSEGDKKQK